MRIIFCLPGNNFSGRFLECWTGLFSYCLDNDIEVIVERREHCNIYYVRNMCLGADFIKGKYQKPYNGQIDYDYIMWIDSDIIFTPRQFQRLLSHEVDIVSGVYLMEGGEYLATVKDWDEEFFKTHGYFKFMKPEDIKHPVQREAIKNNKTKEALIEVSYTGMGFILVKRGVFESLEYPWFRPIETTIGSMVDFTMEDVSFCLQARDKKYKIFIDPMVRVGHEKKVVM